MPARIDPPHDGMAEMLFGRDRELEVVRAFLDTTATRGGGLLLSGEPGIGKTALLETTARTAAATGMRVLRAWGVQFEAEVSFAGLDRLLTPLRHEFEYLSAAHRSALSVVLGLGDGSPPERLVVSNATHALLRQTGKGQPLLVVIDDVQWLDRASAAVLAFVVRRLAGSRIGVLATCRTGTDGFFEAAGLPEHQLPPLADGEASRLVGARFPALAPSVHRRVLAESAGVPLALVELPSTLTAAQGSGLEALPPVLSINERLAGLFASRISELPPATRWLLLVAALQGPGDLSVVQAAARLPEGIAPLGTAERAGLIFIEDGTRRLTFRHPLVRSTVVESAAGVERRRAHRALAEILGEAPERRAWHLAEASVGPDEQVAALLEQAARLSLKRGDAVSAVAALTTAADLSPEPAGRSRRLAEAAYIGADVTGALRDTARVLDQARTADPDVAGSLSAAVVTSLLLLSTDGDVQTAFRLLVGSIETQASHREAPGIAFAEASNTLMQVCYFGGGGAEMWEPLEAAIARLGRDTPETLYLSGSTLRDPARCPPHVLERLDLAIAGLPAAADPAYISRIGTSSFYVDRLADCREAFWRVVQDGRAGGAVTSAIHALSLLALDDLTTGRWDEAQRLADESVSLCDLHGYRLLSWPGRWEQAMLAAGRGEDDTVRALTQEIHHWAAPRGVRVFQDYVRQARAVAAIGRGDFEEAYQQAAGISPAGTLAPYQPHAVCVLLELVEAAVRTNRHAQARAHVTAMREAGIDRVSSRLALVAAGSAAIATSDHTASALYEQALAVPDAERWPFELARVRLCFGEHLRRTRAVARSRAQLQAALDIFERLGARPWATRAIGELRAGGLPVARLGGRSGAALTPQELDIAVLAASGLTNKQIAARLHLSHRTVGAHLYVIFPKLGITSRAALRDALAALPRARQEADGGGRRATRRSDDR